ncbi:von willebrand factor type A (VWA) domain was originally protein (macronuclear) [Tetrahymena thermophila SB210]|uniref:von willebrand factor type A (VWA) domain was originally protein n=1 Tax=Tetrahymena thermophila (strain SB210) TaxID=312017 RepID=I7M0Q6_TETTS|nr:von willebrand factor type A (VWA) domain was originally protein [Tetrahymena thermophila SB210]EAR90750.2 von willebrand factor type A (VWA) domain was originally protein [Tetrahymena thermophila SB210]|eukprot:XP_001010995.2 von willebrand factor type A (VWA) domain was originally protein [Tetrahymena thermophila SB210]
MQRRPQNNQKFKPQQTQQQQQQCQQQERQHFQELLSQINVQQQFHPNLNQQHQHFLELLSQINDQQQFHPNLNQQQFYNNQQVFSLPFQISQEMQQEDNIQEVVKSKQNNKNSYDLEKGLSLDVKTFQKHFQFNNSQDQTIPIMVSVKTLEQTSDMEIQSNLLEGRPNLDLICVIDNSGSMDGEKIENVKNTILQLIDMLNDHDRLSIITFNSYAKQLCGLRKVNKDNKENLQKITKSIQADGGTNITSGLQTAFSILQNRKQRNSVSSVFLLSDGQDNNSDSRIRNLLQTTYQQLQEECFTIHSFGFGNDHDGPLMQRIAQIKDGSFYYVERNDQVDEFFIDALGGLFSVVAQDINISIKINRRDEMFQKFFKNSYVSKTYGPMWKVVNKNEEYTIKINQIFQGVSKDFIFEMTVPKSDFKDFQDFERNLGVLNVQLTAIPTNSEYTTQILKENNLVLTLFTQNEKIAQDSEINDNVEFNYIRVKAAQAMEDAIKYADRNQYQEGQAVLSDMLKKIEKSHPNNQARLQVIKEDLFLCQKNVQPQQYQNQGRFMAQQQCNNNFQQQSYAIRSNDIYQAPMQRKMNSDINENVEFNYLRVKAAQAMEESIQLANKNQYQKGQVILQDIIKKIENSHPNNSEKLSIIKEDLIQCQQNISPQQYKLQGQYQAQQQCNNHFNQQSYAIRGNKDLYQAPKQKQMVSQLQFKKKQSQNKK